MSAPQTWLTCVIGNLRNRLGIALVSLARRTAAPPGVGRFDAHQPPDSFAIDGIVQPAQISDHLEPAIEGCAQKLLVNVSRPPALRTGASTAGSEPIQGPPDNRMRSG